MTPTENMTEHDILVRLTMGRTVNEPWLENQAIAIEEALESRCPDILGPSVTANFQENGWDLDLTILASGMADSYDKLGQVFAIVEETAGIEFVNEGQDEVRSHGFASVQPEENHSGDLAPA
jgi:hypothetical protein